MLPPRPLLSPSPRLPGKLATLDLTANVDVGFGVDVGLASATCTSVGAYTAYTTATLKNNNVKTATTMNSIMRSPGDFQVNRL